MTKKAAGTGRFERFALEGYDNNPTDAGWEALVSVHTYLSAWRCGSGCLAAELNTSSSYSAAERLPVAGDASEEQWWEQPVWQLWQRCYDQPQWGEWLLGLLLLLKLPRLHCSWAAQLPLAPCMETRHSVSMLQRPWYPATMLISSPSYLGGST